MYGFWNAQAQKWRNYRHPQPEYMFVFTEGTGLTVYKGEVQIHLPDRNMLKSRFHTANHVVSGELFDPELELPIHRPFPGQYIWIRNLSTGEFSEAMRVDGSILSRNFAGAFEYVTRYQGYAFPSDLFDFTHVGEPTNVTKIIRVLMYLMMMNDSVAAVSYKKVLRRLDGVFSADGLNFRLQELAAVGLVVFDQERDIIEVTPALVNLMVRATLS